jgi:hypothetical protein
MESVRDGLGKGEFDSTSKTWRRSLSVRREVKVLRVAVVIVRHTASNALLFCSQFKANADASPALNAVFFGSAT